MHLKMVKIVNFVLHIIYNYFFKSTVLEFMPSLQKRKVSWDGEGLKAGSIRGDSHPRFQSCDASRHSHFFHFCVNMSTFCLENQLSWVMKQHQVGEGWGHSQGWGDPPEAPRPDQDCSSSSILSLPAHPSSKVTTSEHENDTEVS